MPSESKSQQRFFGMELARKQAGKSTETGMSESQIKDFAATKHRHLPEHKRKKRMKAFLGQKPKG